MKLAKDPLGNKVALKIMKRTPERARSKDFDMFYNEINVMKKMDHPNILKLISYSEKEKATKKDGTTLNVAYTALEFAEGGELFDYVAETGKFSEPEARFFFHQLIDALEHIHSKGYAHRDIKPENLLLDRNFNIKIADFGFATKDDVCHTRKGTFGYMAPEVLANEEYDGQGEDLFSAAVILFILLTQHPPFVRAEPDDKYYKKIINGNWDEFWEIHSDENLSELFMDMFSKMVKVKPSERLSLDEVKKHKWYTGPVPKSEEIVRKFTQRKLNLKPKESAAEESDQGKVKKNKRARSSKSQKKLKKYTKFLEVSDGDELVDLVVEFAKEECIGFEKSRDYFRVELIVEEGSFKTLIQVNVLKKPEQDLRCLEYILMEGEASVFESVFSRFKLFCADKFD